MDPTVSLDNLAAGSAAADNVTTDVQEDCDGENIFTMFPELFPDNDNQQNPASLVGPTQRRETDPVFTCDPLSNRVNANPPEGNRVHMPIPEGGTTSYNSQLYAANFFGCHLCVDLFFESVSQLQFHLFSAHKKNSWLNIICSDRADDKNKQKTPLLVKCSVPHCKFVTETACGLYEHLDKIHRTALYQCGQCSYNTNRRTRFHMHVKRLHQINPFECSYCKYSAGNYGHLQQHIEGAHVQRLKKCKLCFFTTVWQSSLTKHVRVCHAKK